MDPIAQKVEKSKRVFCQHQKGSKKFRSSGTQGIPCIYAAYCTCGPSANLYSLGIERHKGYSFLLAAGCPLLTQALRALLRMQKDVQNLQCTQRRGGSFRMSAWNHLKQNLWGYRIFMFVMVKCGKWLNAFLKLKSISKALSRKGAMQKARARKNDVLDPHPPSCFFVRVRDKI